AKGIQPTNVIDTRDGQRVEKLIFPGVVVSYGGTETGVMLLKGNKARTSEEEINQSIEGIEFEIANAIYKLTADDPPLVGVVAGPAALDRQSAWSHECAVAYWFITRHPGLHASAVLDCDLRLTSALSVAFSAIGSAALDGISPRGGRVIRRVQ